VTLSAALIATLLGFFISDLVALWRRSRGILTPRLVLDTEATCTIALLTLAESGLFTSATILRLIADLTHRPSPVAPEVRFHFAREDLLRCFLLFGFLARHLWLRKFASKLKKDFSLLSRDIFVELSVDQLVEVQDGLWIWQLVEPDLQESVALFLRKPGFGENSPESDTSNKLGCLFLALRISSQVLREELVLYDSVLPELH